eukprot:3797009-Pleurochrysis_carterae.AAC.1
MRVMHKRGSNGEEYWEYSMTQASLFSNVTHRRLGAADDNLTLHERKPGQPPSVSPDRPMFCLACARSPDALQGRKLEPRADKCIHLGISPNKSGYHLEVRQGPRKGKLNTTTQVVFRKTVFPLRANRQPAEDDTDGPSIDELVVMNDANDDDNVAAAPGVAAGLDTNSDCDSTATPYQRRRHYCVPCPPALGAATSFAGYHLCLYSPA